MVDDGRMSYATLPYFRYGGSGRVSSNSWLWPIFMILFLAFCIGMGLRGGHGKKDEHQDEKRLNSDGEAHNGSGHIH